MNSSQPDKPQSYDLRAMICAPLLALLVCSACGRSQTSSEDIPVRMSLAAQTGMIYLATTLAQQLNYYEQDLLHVTLNDTPGGSKALEALLGGSADVVAGFL